MHKAWDMEDHLGAICCLGNGVLLAANWDTLRIYRIDSGTGKTTAEKEWASMLPPDFPHLAVQDWKFDRSAGWLIASGIDKSKPSVSEARKAILAFIDLEKRTFDIHRLPPRSDVARPLTNEGMVIVDGNLYLLPEDFGKGAKLLRFSMD